MRYSSGPSFTIHTPCHPWGTDPSLSNKGQGQPAPLRQTYTLAWIKRGNGSGQVGRMGGVVASATAQITVTQANCVAGRHSIRIGPYELRPAVDFAIGVDDVALAANLAAAITALPGFTAASDGVDTVTVSAPASAVLHRAEIVEWGAASAFVLGALVRSGFMDMGAPAPLAPLIA